MSAAGDRKTIFITGAASGIGRETARLFASKNWFCGLYDINADGLAETLSMIGHENGVTGLLDVRDRTQWQAAVSAFSKSTDDRMNVMFNNAGIGSGGKFMELDQDEADRIIDVNLKGVVNGIYASLPTIRASNGRIINTSSVAGIYGTPNIAVYSATKFAVRGLTEALDLELANENASCVSVMPFFIDTPILEGTGEDGSNMSMGERLKEAGIDVYPVSMAGKRVWDAAHGKDVHYTVGKQANRLQLLARLFPGFVRKSLGKQTGLDDIQL